MQFFMFIQKACEFEVMEANNTKLSVNDRNDTQLKADTIAFNNKCIECIKKIFIANNDIFICML